MVYDEGMHPRVETRLDCSTLERMSFSESSWLREIVLLASIEGSWWQFVQARKVHRHAPLPPFTGIGALMVNALPSLLPTWFNTDEIAVVVLVATASPGETTNPRYRPGLPRSGAPP